MQEADKRNRCNLQFLHFLTLYIPSVYFSFLWYFHVRLFFFSFLFFSSSTDFVACFNFSLHREDLSRRGPLSNGKTASSLLSYHEDERDIRGGIRSKEKNDWTKKWEKKEKKYTTKDTMATLVGWEDEKHEEGRKAAARSKQCWERSRLTLR